MKKLFSIMLAGLLVLSAGAFAADATVSVASVKNRANTTYGSEARVAVREDAFSVGLETQKVGVAMRNQGDVYWTPVDVYGITAGVGLGYVTDSVVKNHGVYLGKVGYAYDFGNQWKANVGLAYRNDFDNLILDRKTTASVGGTYNFDAKTYAGATYARSYGDSKQDNFAVSVNRKF